MARILYNSEWFDEVDSRGHYESEYEDVLSEEAKKLFSSYFFVPFKTPVVSEIDADARKPDFALIDKNYRSWWVVEVELGHHPLNGHVVPQVRTFSNAKYGREQAEYLCEKEPMLSEEKILEMFKGSSPRVLVIVNSPVSGWAEELRVFDARVVICQIFRNRMNKYLLRLNGEYPSEQDEVITSCECSLLLSRMLVIHSPAQLGLKKDEHVWMFYNGQASEWARTDTAGNVYLFSLKGHNLEPGKQYDIIRQGDGTLGIRQKKK